MRENGLNPNLNLKGAEFLVVGLGVSGYWAARWLAKMGARVRVSEMKDASALNPEFVQTLESEGIAIEAGGHQMETFRNSNGVILSPGVPENTSFIQAARQMGVPVMGEMELAVRFTDAPVIAVTGTNGKTTTTRLLGQVFENAGDNVFVGGNIGTPLSAYLFQEETADTVVLEVSSFQLDTMTRFCPKISIILNVSPDHLDRYTDYRAYISSKLSIYQNQGPRQTVILNDADPALAGVSISSGASELRYGLECKPRRKAFVEHGKLVSLLPPKTRFDLGAFALPGNHNLENLLAVVLAAQTLGVDPRFIQKAIDTFKGLPNRISHEGNMRGVSFYNDSKATNVDAAVKAISSFEGPLILIAGGRHKGFDYDPLLQAARQNVKGAVFMGESAKLLAKTFTHQLPSEMASNMSEAVSKAFKMAHEGDTVLLAPACSSFDMFTDYTHRGKAYREAILELKHDR